MSNQLIMPAVSKYTMDLSRTIKDKREIGIDAGYETEVASALSDLNTQAYLKTKELKAAIDDVKKMHGAERVAKAYAKKVLVKMEELRTLVDTMESMMTKEYWPMPTYGDLLFSVK